MRKLIFALGATLIFISCENKGGKWSQADEQQWMQVCTGQANNMDAATSKNYCSCMMEKLEQKYTSYADMNQKGTYEDGVTLGKACLQSINRGGNVNNNNGNGGGGLGGGNNNGAAWSANDEQKFMGTCIQNATNAGADQQTATAHCNCTLKKIQAKYSSYDEANTKMTTQQVTAMEQECNDNNNGAGNNNDNGNNNNNNGGGILGGINNNNNNGGGMGGGAWSASDEQKFMGSCIQNATNAGADRQTANAHCSCTLKKIQTKYSSYDEANTKMTKQEVTAMEQECNDNNNNNQ